MSRLCSVVEKTRALAAVGLALYPSPGLYHCGVRGVCLGSLEWRRAPEQQETSPHSSCRGRGGTWGVAPWRVALEKSVLGLALWLFSPRLCGPGSVEG